jgi:small-conductance mechanosensitive channel
MTETWENLKAISTAKMGDWLAALALLLMGFVAARILRGAFRRLVGPHLGVRYSPIAEKAVYYFVLGVAALSALQAAGADLSFLLGAAGVLTLALGFASQTSVSNLISGLFLVGERTFQIGDVIRVGDKLGVVTSIDLLSVKLRTFDNLLVRLPNETLLKAEITTLTHFPIRRLDLTIGVAYKEDVERVKEILFEVAEKNTYCLDEPKPLFWFSGYGDSAVLLRFSAWFAIGNYFEAINRLQQQIYEALTEAGVEIPFPHRTLYTGSETEPFPVRVVGANPPNPPFSKGGR